MPILSFFGQLFPGFGAFQGQKHAFCPQQVFPIAIIRPSRAQNWHFCALLSFPRALFRPFERKTTLFARFCPSRWHFSGLPSAKPHFLRAFLVWGLDSYLASPIIFAPVNTFRYLSAWISIKIMSNNRFKIGEFSRLGRVTVRTLRHYDQIDLLKPEVIDRWTGYRYYSAGQLQKMLAIVKLKDLGFSLAEIGSLFEDDTHYPQRATLEKKIAECRTQLRRLEERLNLLNALIDEEKRKKKMEKIYFDTLPAIIVASNKTVLPNYEALGPHLVKIVAPEMARLHCECPEPGYCFTTETSGEYKEENFEIEYCEKVKERGTDSEIIKFKELEEVPTAICMNVYGPYNRLKDAYLELFSEITRMGYEIIGAPRANYVDGCWNEENPEKWLTIIQVPVKRA